MAKRIMDRRALRAQADAAERREGELEGEDTGIAGSGDEAAGEIAEKPARAKAKSATPKVRKTKPRASKAAPRMRIIWTVCDNSTKTVARYQYPQREEADAHAARLTAEKNVRHFVMPIKEAIEE